MGCGCGGSSWTPTPPAGVTFPEEQTVGPRGIENPATFWTGPEAPADPTPAEPVPAGAE